ncbi:alpha-1,4-glucan--maltose-1-phosphate maltosyltransferase [Fulvivirga lutimaris]|uniref:alpha-1,4-glucan--maltose-1-phosphate maltosyltransferase n=1 Tax=Fulvivirga lutimaris TaxID=1819566 RepID=UPI0012BC58AA|nr:alpha-1,4-glucan--maltose-1-phosphate maltosyltransferase [Fulvivirga lutimaris]MTI39522.1 alpha-1,4-glucan--maltose-1-phosphate maltosyltransferase [Fulvivirga lutimaris]
MLSGQIRVIIENVQPEIDYGKFYIKRVVGQNVDVTADIFTDGHDVINARLLFKHEKDKQWSSIEMEHTVNDSWSGSFKVAKQGTYTYTIEAWVDYALNWQHNIERKIDDDQQVDVELLDGVQYLKAIKSKTTAPEKKYLDELIKLFANKKEYKKAIKEAHGKKLEAIFHKYPSDKFTLRYERELDVYVDRNKALFSTWYEFFPRSSSAVEGQHGTFKECEAILPEIAAMGFDTLYFPPIHPIGEDFRKGKNNSTKALPGEPGSPWAIGGKAGGHTEILPELGTLSDFKSLIKAADKHGIELAMDFALQCAPNHPYVKQHPQWFKWRPDGSVQYAENPPKKYQDILPIHFECDDWQNLWDELVDVALYWAKQGIRIFRVDNPHTKPFRFWEYLIAKVKAKYPDFLFLAEAFTRPKIMAQLAKVGFSQSYSYFTWRNSKHELMEYLTELSQTELKDYFRPNFWPNTPDINPYQLQSGNENIFITRYILAATMSSNIGIYGPVYEQMIHDAIIGKEEYLDSEKYEVKHYDWKKKNKLKGIITAVNKIRHQQTALQDTNNIQFCSIDNDNIIAYIKVSPDDKSRILTVVNLDPYSKQSGWVQVPLNQLNIKEGARFTVKDLVAETAYTWDKEWNYVELGNHGLPFHIFKIEI